MADLELPVVFGPEAAAEWFARWQAVELEPDVQLIAPPSSTRHTGALALLAAGLGARHERGLRTATGRTGFVPADVEALFTAAASSPLFTGESGPALLGVPILDLAAAKWLADEAAKMLASRTPTISPSVVRMARFVLEELGANVVQHSGRPGTGHGLLQLSDDRSRLELAVADCGVGFKASLERNPDLENRVRDDADAIQLALSPRITGTHAPRKNMGIGMKLLVDFSDLLGGDLWIASGSALLHRRTAAGERVNSIRPIAPWRGSWICLDAPSG